MTNTPDNRGAIGEEQLLKKLSGFTRPRYYLKNLYVPTTGGTTEIDLLMLHETGIYVFESKNYSGWIFGKEQDQNWTQTLPGGSHSTFYNPIKQNYSHVKALDRFIGERSAVSIFSYIVFGNDCTFKDIETDRTSTHRLVLLKDVRSTVQADLEYFDKYYTDEELENLYRILEPLTHADYETKSRHVENIRQKYGSQPSSSGGRSYSGYQSAADKGYYPARDESSRNTSQSTGRMNQSSSDSAQNSGSSFENEIIRKILIVLVLVLILSIARSCVKSSGASRTAVPSKPAVSDVKEDAEDEKRDNDLSNGKVLYCKYSDLPSTITVKNTLFSGQYVTVYHYGDEVLSFYVDSRDTATVSSPRGTFSIVCKTAKGKETYNESGVAVAFGENYTFEIG